MNCSTFGKICLAAATSLCLSASVAHAAGLETLSIKKQTSHYMNMGQQITRIAVGNPGIASVVQLPGSANEFLIVTKDAVGSTSLFVWTRDNVRHEYLIVVSPEDPGQAMLIEKAIGLPNVHVKMVGERILLTGTVEDQYQKNYALQTARLFVNAGTESSLLVGSGFDMTLDTASATSSGGGSGEVSRSESTGQIIDLLQILHPTQIRLEAQIIEINSDDAKDLGLRYGQDPANAPGIFAFGEDYARTNTYISETFSGDGSNSYGNNSSNSYSGSNSDSFSGSSSNSFSGSSSNSFSGGNGDSFSGSSSNSFSRTQTYTDNEGYTVTRGDGYGNSYGNNYSNSYSNGYSNSYNNGYSNSYNNGYSNSYNNSNGGNSSNSFASSFSRSVTSSWYDMVQFGNNPLKWIIQHFAPINVSLNLLVTQGKAKILSRPSVMTLSGEQATIQIGGKIPYTSTNNNGGSNVQFEDYGIILQFKPVVDAQKRINSAVHAEVSNISGQAVNGQPIIGTRRADSVITLHSGSPIVIGGLMDSSETKTVQKIPLLGDIPIIGEFFKHTSRSRDKRELIIVVTPHLVGEDERSQFPMSTTMMQWLYEEQQYRDTMNHFDFAAPNFDAVKKKDKKSEKSVENTTDNSTAETTEPFK